MQTTTGTLSVTPGRIAAQAILIIAVAMGSVAFGRWIIPADSNSGGATGVSGIPETSVAAAIAQLKYDSGTLDDVVFGETIVLGISVPNSGDAAEAIAEHKFNSGTLEETLFGETAVLGVSIEPEMVSPAASITQRKYDSGRLAEVLFGTN
jgi:hypothetical protein